MSLGRGPKNNLLVGVEPPALFGAESVGRGNSFPLLFFFFWRRGLDRSPDVKARLWTALFGAAATGTRPPRPGDGRPVSLARSVSQNRLAVTQLNLFPAASYAGDSSAARRGFKRTPKPRGVSDPVAQRAAV